MLRNFATDEVPTFSYSPFSLALEQKCWDLQNDKSPINEEAICVAEILEKGWENLFLKEPTKIGL